MRRSTPRWASLGALPALGLLASGCAGLVGLDEFSEALDGHGLTEPDQYRFAQGAAQFSIAAAQGVSANDHAEALAVSPGPVTTARGGQADLAADGSFSYRPPGDAGAFFGDDAFEYTLESGRRRERGLARLTVQPLALRLDAVAGSAGAGFGMFGATGFLLGMTPGSLAAAGDVNGDGKDDLLLAAPGADLAGYASFVVFGKADTEPIPVQGLLQTSSGGLVLESDVDGERLAVWSGAGAGDVNGDGLDDVIVGAPGYLEDEASEDGFAPGPLPGRAYVLFGRPDSAQTTTSELLAGSPAGFVIEGAPDDLVGLAVSGAGDVNGDGLADVIVGAPFADANGQADSGAAYVVFGKRGAERVKLMDLPAAGGGLALYGASAKAFAGSAVTRAGDVNGDGLSDVLVGAPDHGRAEQPSVGMAYVVFGRRETSAVQLDELGAGSTQGFAIAGVDADDSAGFPVHGTGDVNGDGLDDVAIGAVKATLDVASPAGADGAAAVEAGWGVVYVVFGKRDATAVDLRDLEQQRGGGFAIAGSPPLLGAGLALSAGDVDGDGLADLLIGTRPSETQSKAYLVFGKPDEASVSLGDLEVGGRGGLPIFGAGGDVAGFGCATGADVNGDGLDDVVVGIGVYPGAPPVAGGASVVFGWDMSGALGRRHGALLGGHMKDTLAIDADDFIRVRGGSGRDTLQLRGSGQELELGSARFESIEVVDLRGDGPNVLRLNDAAVRNVPASQASLPFELSKTLTLIADPDDTVYFELSGYTQVGGNEGRLVYARDGAHYGLEVARGTRIVAPSSR